MNEASLQFPCFLFLKKKDEEGFPEREESRIAYFDSLIENEIISRSRYRETKNKTRVIRWKREEEDWRLNYGEN